MSSSPSSEWEVESLRLVLTDSAVSSVSQKRSFDDGDEEEEGRRRGDAEATWGT